MAGFKAYYEGEGLSLKTLVILDKEESHHLIKVLRANTDAAVTLFNGRGEAWSCQIKEANAKGARLLVESCQVVPCRTIPLILVQALPKSGSMETIVRKAVEIGVSTIIPLITERTEVRLSAERAQAKVQKWRQIALEACKQSGNYILPEIHDIQDLKNLLTAYINSYSQFSQWVASLEAGAKRLREYENLKNVKGLVLAVGPEGDFTPKEYGQLSQAGYCPLKLGEHVLRVETASVYGLSVLDSVFGEYQ